MEIEKNEKISKMTFAPIYPLYVNKVEKKGRTKYRIEEIDFELTRHARYLDKLVDELARGRKIEKILREDKSSYR